MVLLYGAFVWCFCTVLLYGAFVLCFCMVPWLRSTRPPRRLNSERSPRTAERAPNVQVLHTRLFHRDGIRDGPRGPREDPPGADKTAQESTTMAPREPKKGIFLSAQQRRRLRMAFEPFPPRLPQEPPGGPRSPGASKRAPKPPRCPREPSKRLVTGIPRDSRIHPRGSLPTARAPWRLGPKSTRSAAPG